MYREAGNGKKLRVAAYCRVSTDNRDQANSFLNQQVFFTEYIRKHPDWQLQQIYADEGISGTATAGRTAFQRMIRAAENGALDLILTKEVSRFARNTVDALSYTRKLRSIGVGVIFLNDNIHTLDTDGELRLTLMASMAQEESRKTSERVKWGQQRRMEQGVVFGPSLLGYTVKGGMITPEPRGAAVVRRIFHQYLQEGKGCAAIAAALRQEGIPSSRGEIKWSAATVRKVLKNEKYCGDLVQRKTCTPDYLTHYKRYNRDKSQWIVVENHHEAIISRSCWQAVQQEMARRAAGREGAFSSRQYPFSGKLHCACCGSGFVSRRKNGEQLWRCGKAAYEGSRVVFSREKGTVGCDIGRQLKNGQAVEMTRQALRSLELDREEIMQEVLHLIRETAPEEKPSEKPEILQQELAFLQKRKNRLTEQYLQGELEEEEFCFAIGQYRKQAARLRQGLQEEHVSGFEAESLRPVLNALLSEEGEAICGHLLQEMKIDRQGNVSLRLKHCEAVWLFALPK